MNRRQFLHLAVLSAVARHANAEQYVETNLALSGALAFVPVSVGASQPALFLIDTGAAVTVVDGAMANVVGMDRALPLTRPIRAPKTTFTAAGQSRELEPALIDLKSVAASVGLPVAGLLGSDFLSGFNVRLDYSTRTLALGPAKMFKGPSAFALRFDDMPFIRASIRREGIVMDGEFGLDTGLDSFAKLTSSRARQVFSGLETVQRQGITIAGEKPQQIAPFDALRIGGLDIPNITASISDDAPPRGAGPDFVGMIGSPAFLNRVLTFDAAGGWCSLSPVIL
jgi:predicted aspartyl protease